MAASKALKRLLRVRGLEEEQQRTALESALAELHRIDAALDDSSARQRRGRELMGAAEDIAERQAGRVEWDAAQRLARVLALRRVELEGEATRLRAAFLEKRIERRQAETLVDEAHAQEQLTISRRAQQSLDEWHASKGAGSLARPDPAKDEGIKSKDAIACSDPGKEFHF